MSWSNERRSFWCCIKIMMVWCLCNDHDPFQIAISKRSTVIITQSAKKIRKSSSRKSSNMSCITVSQCIILINPTNIRNGKCLFFFAVALRLSSSFSSRCSRKWSISAAYDVYDTKSFCMQLMCLLHSKSLDAYTGIYQRSARLFNFLPAWCANTNKTF